MVNLVYNQLQENIIERQKVDKPLINWFLLTFVFFILSEIDEWMRENKIITKWLNKKFKKENENE